MKRGTGCKGVTKSQVFSGLYMEIFSFNRRNKCFNNSRGRGPTQRGLIWIEY